MPRMGPAATERDGLRAIIEHDRKDTGVSGRSQIGIREQGWAR